MAIVDGRYLLSRDDGIRLDHGVSVIGTGHRLELTPHATSGAVVFRASVDGNVFSAVQVSNTTPPTDGVSDHIWMNLLLETSPFEWAGPCPG